MRIDTFCLVAITLCAAACKETSPSGSTPGAASASAAATKPTEAVNLNGAGATFPYPLYSKWISAYGNANPNVRINYQSVGSGAGIKQITDKTVDFGASDAPMTDEQLAKVDRKLLHIPTTLGAVVISYNLPDMSGELRLTGDLIGERTPVTGSVAQRHVHVAGGRDAEADARGEEVPDLDNVLGRLLHVRQDGMVGGSALGHDLRQQPQGFPHGGAVAVGGRHRQLVDDQSS